MWNKSGLDFYIQGLNSIKFSSLIDAQRNHFINGVLVLLYLKYIVLSTEFEYLCHLLYTAAGSKCD